MPLPCIAHWSSELRRPVYRAGEAMPRTWPGFLPTRRQTSRVATPEGVWAIWRANGRDDVSRISDISMGGVFLRTPTSKPVGTTINLHFLVREGQVRADATVRHIRPQQGLGLEFTALIDDDRPRLAALMRRLRSLSAGPENVSGKRVGESLA